MRKLIHKLLVKLRLKDETFEFREDEMNVVISESYKSRVHEFAGMQHKRRLDISELENQTKAEMQDIIFAMWMMRR